jgi:hypothetical protein
MALSLNPETELLRKQRRNVPDMVREFDAKQALKSIYTAKAAAVGMTLASYCARFGIRGVL